MAAVANGRVDPAASGRVDGVKHSAGLLNDAVASGRIDPRASARVDGVYRAPLIIRSDPRIASRARPLRLSACKGSMPQHAVAFELGLVFTALIAVEPTAALYTITTSGTHELNPAAAKAKLTSWLASCNTLASLRKTQES